MNVAEFDATTDLAPYNPTARVICHTLYNFPTPKLTRTGPISSGSMLKPLHDSTEKCHAAS
jgi:hypothetical protein